MRTVVVAVDWSPESEHAVTFACDFARARGAGIVLLHVRAPGPTSGRSSSPSKRAAAPDPPERILDDWVSRVRDSGIAHVESVLLDGPPVDAILTYAEAHPPDLLVFGRRGRSTGSRILGGGVASAVMQHARWPVLLVP